MQKPLKLQGGHIDRKAFPFEVQESIDSHHAELYQPPTSQPLAEKRKQSVLSLEVTSSRASAFNDLRGTLNMTGEGGES